MEILKKNEIHRAVIEGYNSAGLGVTHLAGRAVFVEGTARGDECLLRLVKVPATGPVFAKTERLITPSGARRESGCPSAAQCGGCAFQHISYEEELALKLARVQDALTRIAKIDLAVERIVPAAAVYGYRNKALFPVRMSDGQPVIGFFRARSHTIVPIETCVIQNEQANRCARAVRDWMKTYKVPAYDEQTGEGLVRHVYVRTNADNQALCCLVTTRPKLPQSPALIRALRAACPGLIGIVVQTNTRRDNVILTGRQHALWGTDVLEDVLCSLRFSLSVTSFYQVNRDMAERLYETAVTMADLTGTETVLDLFCGTGTLSLCMASRANHVIGVDVVAAAIADARRNADRNSLANTEFLCADAAEAAESLIQRKQRIDVLVVDPPRRGLDEAVIAAVKTIAPERMVYVSCDPATLSRDLSRLNEAGYRATRCVAVDMFPRTANVETVVRLSRAGAGLDNR